VQVNTESLTSILAGGLAFLTPADSPDEPAAAERAFRLFATREEAIRRQVDERQHYVLRFTESVRGLSVGAPVDFRGITIGEVIAIQPQLSPASAEISMQVEVSLQPGRLRTRAASRTCRPAPPAKTRPSVRLSTSSSPRACAPSCATATWSPASSTWPSTSSPAPARPAPTGPPARPGCRPSAAASTSCRPP
jgi:paraquat-inducible protein B